MKDGNQGDFKKGVVALDLVAVGKFEISHVSNIWRSVKTKSITQAIFKIMSDDAISAADV